MPADPKPKLKRRSSRRDVDEYKFDGGSHARELELKRSRGEISCAECRRLKIKCDKQIPCQSCQRRGCAALCPNGSLATGQGTRFVLAATEHLHRRIAKLGERIRVLEDALASLHSKHSEEPHPLLREDLLCGNSDDKDADMPMVGDEAGPSQSPDVIDAFGTLSISDHGISRFFGPTGGSESLLISSLVSSHTSPASSHSLSPKTGSLSPNSNSASSTTYEQLSLFSRSFPFTPLGRTEDIQEMIETHLPPYDRAAQLCQTYFDQVSWLFRGVTKEQLMDEMLALVYRRPSAVGMEDEYGPHDLALLFIIFAIGALVEPELELQPNSNQPLEQASPTASSDALAEHFHQISRAALTLQPVLEKPSIVTIQTLHLMSIYNAMSGSDLTSETSMEMTWSLLTLAAHLSQTIGLHRDSERWGLPPKMVQRRRILFWDLFVADVWTSLNTGRPPSFSLAYIDCNFPRYDEQQAKSGDLAFEVWQFRFAAECVADVTARTLTAEAPSYTTIIELDRKVREFPLPEDTRDKDDMAASFRRCVLEHIRETVLMYIHRSFFAQAIIEQPINPLKSVYAPSFLAAYRASATILKSVREQFSKWPNSCARHWSMWTFAFSAAVVFGTVVTRGPRSPLASSAMTELEQACILFSKAAVYSKRATKALPILTRLSEKAHHALSAAQSDPSGENGGALWNIKQEDTDDELNIFAGHTRFVSSKKQSHSVPTLLPIVNHHLATYEAQSQVTYDPPQPLPPHHPQSHSHRVSWTADQSQGSLRDEYRQNRTAIAPSTSLHPHPPVNFSYSYDRSSHPEAPRYVWASTSTRQTYDPSPERYQYPTASHPQDYSAIPSRGQIELANLGLASRDSRLDERWSSFMHDSGLLDGVGVNYRSN